MNNSELTFLGSDSGFGENNNSAYMICGTRFFLIDCGYTVFNILREKFDFDKFSEINVIITHLHNDHAGSLSQFIMYLWFIKGKRACVYSKCERIREYLDCTGSPREAYELKSEYISNDITVNFIKTEHVKDLDSYGVYINKNGKRFIYTGDTNTINPFMKYIEDGIDELYVDTSVNGGVHLALKDIIDTLNEAGKKRYECVFDAY